MSNDNKFMNRQAEKIVHCYGLNVTINGILLLLPNMAIRSFWSMNKSKYSTIQILKVCTWLKSSVLEIRIAFKSHIRCEIPSKI